MARQFDDIKNNTGMFDYIRGLGAAIDELRAEKRLMEEHIARLEKQIVKRREAA